MAPRKKTRRAKASAPKPRKSSPTKTIALAVPDAIVRAELPRPARGGYQALLHAMLDLSPMHVLVAQQAAFWQGFAGPVHADRAGSRKRILSR
jgi:hypothetical protein